MSYKQNTSALSFFGGIRVDWGGREGCLEEAGSTGDEAEEWEAEWAWAWVQDNVVNPNVERAEPFFTLLQS